MKSLIQFIKESYDVYQLKEITVKYTINPEEYIVQGPTSYSEDDITIYMGDKLFNNIPSSEDNAKKFFGKNAENIFDVYFEYDGFEYNEDLNYKKPNLEWDAHYDKNLNNNDVKLINFVFKNIKLVIKFDKFEIQYGEGDDIKQTLETIFMATVSNDQNEYDLTLTLDPNNIEYKK